MQYIQRYVEKRITELSRHFPVILVTGARQVGKTTVLRHLAATNKGRKRGYVTLDDFGMRTLAQQDPGLFIAEHPAPVLIDEIQYAPQLLTYIKMAVDNNKRAGAYWLTGSQQFHLMKNVSESLAGRVAILKLSGFSFAEERGLPFLKNRWVPAQHGREPRAEYVALSPQEIFALIIRGSFPGVFAMSLRNVEAFYGSYVQTYIDRDIRDLTRVTDLSRFQKFVQVCAARTASLLNIADLARDSEISVNTAKAWLGLLEASHQIFLLRPYHKNLTKRLVKAPKLYFLDTGLVSYITGWRTAQTALRGAMAGQLFETFVVSEILKSYWHRGIEPRIFYYRTKEKAEVDVLLEDNGVVYPVEIKLGALIRAADLRGIFALYSKGGANIGDGVVIAPVTKPYVVSVGSRWVWVLPLTAIK